MLIIHQMYIYIYTHTHTYTYAHIYVHTHTHIYKYTCVYMKPNLLICPWPPLFLFGNPTFVFQVCVCVAVF